MNKPKITFGSIKIALNSNKPTDENEDKPETSGNFVKFLNTEIYF